MWSEIKNPKMTLSYVHKQEYVLAIFIIDIKESDILMNIYEEQCSWCHVYEPL